MLGNIFNTISQYMPMVVKPTDIIEIIIIAFVFYHIMLWIKIPEHGHYLKVLLSY